MFLTREIKKLSKLLDVDVGADDILEKDEIDAVKKTTNINRIRDQLIVPKHKRTKKTITLVKVFTAKFDLTDFISDIISSLRPSYEIRLGCSFIMFDGLSPSYVYSIPARPINDAYRIIRDEDDENKLMQFVKGYTYSDFLLHAFQQRNTLNPFEKSGYRPEKIVCVTAWITKYSNPVF